MTKKLDLSMVEKAPYLLVSYGAFFVAWCRIGDHTKESIMDLSVFITLTTFLLTFFKEELKGWLRSF